MSTSKTVVNKWLRKNHKVFNSQEEIGLQIKLEGKRGGREVSQLFIEN